MEVEPASMNSSSHRQSDIEMAVTTARAELEAVIRSLTEVLDVVASGELNKEWPDTEAAKREREELVKRRSLDPVMARFDKLRASVELATSLHKQKVSRMKQEEAKVTDAEKAQLVEKRKALIEEVTLKNNKIRILIDHLRDLHKDIVLCLNSYFKPIQTQNKGKKT